MKSTTDNRPVDATNSVDVELHQYGVRGWCYVCHKVIEKFETVGTLKRYNRLKLRGDHNDDICLGCIGSGQTAIRERLADRAAYQAQKATLLSADTIFRSEVRHLEGESMWLNEDSLARWNLPSPEDISAYEQELEAIYMGRVESAPEAI